MADNRQSGPSTTRATDLDRADADSAGTGDTEPAAQIRASDAEREAVATQLRDAVGEGRLGLEEFTERVEAVYAATHRTQLDRLTADLPGSAALPAGADGTPGDVVTAPAQVTGVFGDLKRSGGWLVPAQGSWSTVFGDVVLDLREARLSAPEVRIDIRTFTGDVDLLVPDGVLVEVRGRTIFGDTRQRAGQTAPAGAPRIVLTGGTVFGDIKVRSERLRERWMRRWLAPPGSQQ